MNTFLRIIALIGIIVLFYGISILRTRVRHDWSPKNKCDYKDIIYYVISVIAIVVIMVFTFPTYIPLAWGKIILLAITLTGLNTFYWFAPSDDFLGIHFTVFLIVILISCGVIHMPTGKQQYGEEITDKKSYSIAITSDENNEVAVQKVVEDNEEYYIFTYFDENRNPVNVKTTDAESEIIINSSEKETATCEVEETLYIYNHSEITDKGDNFTFEDEVKYTVYVSKDLFYDPTV